MKNKGKSYFLIPYYLWIALFVIAPVLLVVYYSLFDLDGHLTLDNYVNFFTPVYMKMMLNSFWYAFLITLFSLLVAYPAAYLLTRTKHKQLWLLLIILPTWINLLLKTYAFIGIFGTFGPVNNFFGLLGIGEQQILFTGFSFVFVSVYIFIPFMILPIFSALEELNLSLVDAARDLGCRARSGRFRVDDVPAGDLSANDFRGAFRLYGSLHPGAVAVHDYAPHRRQPGHYTGHCD
ncbi:Spermidine/putrescine transport system permease protein PotB [compost metagenome]